MQKSIYFVCVCEREREFLSLFQEVNSIISTPLIFLMRERKSFFFLDEKEKKTKS